MRRSHTMLLSMFAGARDAVLHVLTPPTGDLTQELRPIPVRADRRKQSRLF